MSFEFLSNRMNISSLEGPEEPIVEKLLELGVNFNVTRNWDGRFIYKFLDVVEVGPGAFWLDSGDKKILFLASHFDGGKFRNLEDGREVLPEELLESISKKFSEADEIICSCCSPDDARAAFQDLDVKPIIIGSGRIKYKTVHNSRKNFITVSADV